MLGSKLQQTGRWLKSRSPWTVRWGSWLAGQIISTSPCPTRLSHRTRALAPQWIVSKTKYDSPCQALNVTLKHSVNIHEHITCKKECVDFVRQAKSGVDLSRIVSFTLSTTFNPWLPRCTIMLVLPGVTTCFSFLSSCIYFERQRESKCEWRRAEREGDTIPSRLCPISAEPDAGLDLMNLKS